MKINVILGRLLIVVAVLFGLQQFIIPLGSSMLAQIFPSIVVDLTNRDRTLLNLSRLTINPQLMEAAQLKAQDMAARGYFAHNTPEGDSPWYWFDKAKYPFVYAGENLALNFDDSEKVQQAWMESESHRSNIVNVHFTEIGVGIATGTYKGQPATFVAQLFGSR